MATSPLDNPIWHGLSGPHAHFSRRSGDMLAYRPEIALFVAAADPTDSPMEGLADLIAPDGTLGFATALPPALPPDVEAVRVVAVPQMVAAKFRPAEVTAPMATLGTAERDAMVALVELTHPGPFQPETYRMGHFRGIFADGRLAAMTGERMKLDGMTEISAVCVHPDYRGRGYARQLVSAAGNEIVARGETPFLHVVADNAPAIALYETLGFAIRHVMTYTIVRRRSA